MEGFSRSARRIKNSPSIVKQRSNHLNPCASAFVYFSSRTNLTETWATAVTSPPPIFTIEEVTEESSLPFPFGFDANTDQDR